MKIGVISDTHGLLRPEAVETLRGSDLIIHAGDIGDAGILDELKKISPVAAVRGNIDQDIDVNELKMIEIISAGKFNILVIHKIGDFVPEAFKEKIDAVIFGHSHIPSMEYKDGILYFNPGSAGRRRFKLPVSMGIITIKNNSLIPELINL